MTDVIGAHGVWGANGLVPWTSNADMIAGVASLGYLNGIVLDATYGKGNFWTVHRPQFLLTNDKYTPADKDWDYRDIPLPDSSFNTVVFDPPYKLTGTSQLRAMDASYGNKGGIKWEEVMEDIRLGSLECFRVCRDFLLVKCQDQVAYRHVRWQTDLITGAIEGVGGTKEGRFDLLRTPMPQRSQVHERRDTSQLLVFAK